MSEGEKNKVHKFNTEFKTHNLTWNEETQETQIYAEYLIDGKSLREILADENSDNHFIECYIGLLPSYLYLLSTNNIEGGSNVLVEENGTRVILICNICGELLCSDVACEIEVDGEYVIWKNFMKPIYDNKYTDYQGGPFVFNREEYENALKVRV